MDVTSSTQRSAIMTERRMDAEFTADELNILHVLAIRERARLHDQCPRIVNLARKLAEYKRRIGV